MRTSETLSVQHSLTEPYKQRQTYYEHTDYMRIGTPGKIPWVHCLPLFQKMKKTNLICKKVIKLESKYLKQLITFSACIQTAASQIEMDQSVQTMKPFLCLCPS